MLNSAPRHVEQNLILQNQRDKDFVRHLHQKAKVKPAFSAQEVEDTVKFQLEYKKALKAQNKTFNQNEKNIGLNRENAILLNKLVDISQGKWSSVHGPATYKKKKATNASQGPRSLNISVRRKENERIERENHAFAKRLFQNSGSISKAKLDLQYNEQLALKNRIRRVKKPLPNLGGRATQLPPLESSVFKASKRSFSVKQNSMHGRDSNPQKMFATHGEYDLNQSSANAIPINSMYDGEEERKAAIPPPKEGLEESIPEATEEVKEEAKLDVQSAQHEEEKKETEAAVSEQPAQSATGKSVASKKAQSQVDIQPKPATPPIAQVEEETISQPSKVETVSKKESQEELQQQPTQAIAEEPMPKHQETIPQENMPRTESIPEENMPAQEYQPSQDEDNEEGGIHESINIEESAGANKRD